MEYLCWIVKTGKILVHRRFCYPRNVNEIYIAELYTGCSHGVGGKFKGF